MKHPNLQIATVSTEWKKSIIAQIPKSGENDPKVPLNCSLLQYISKLYISVFNTLMSNYLETNKLLTEEQNGFRNGCSCQEHIFSLHSCEKHVKHKMYGN